MCVFFIYFCPPTVSRKHKWERQSQYALVGGLSDLQGPKLHAGLWMEEAKQNTSCTPHPSCKNLEQTLDNCTTKAQLDTSLWILSRKRWTCHLSYHIFASHEFSSTPLHICFLFFPSYYFIFRWMQINAKYSFKYALILELAPPKLKVVILVSPQPCLLPQVIFLQSCSGPLPFQVLLRDWPFAQCCSETLMWLAWKKTSRLSMRLVRVLTISAWGPSKHRSSFQSGLGRENIEAAVCRGLRYIDWR